MDYIDVFHWGCIGRHDEPSLRRCLRMAVGLRGPDTPAQREIERLVGASERLKSLGAVRFIGASFHDVDLARRMAGEGELDVVMLRLNPAHRRTRGVLEHLPAAPGLRPGVVAFKAAGCAAEFARECNGARRGATPAVPDLYRYALSQPNVDMCLTGPSNRSEIDQALEAVERGPLFDDEITGMERTADRLRPRARSAGTEVAAH